MDDRAHFLVNCLVKLCHRLGLTDEQEQILAAHLLNNSNYPSEQTFYEHLMPNVKDGLYLLIKEDLTIEAKASDLED